MRISILAATVLALLVGADSALAADASCKKANARQEHTFKDYVPIEGVGLVTWRATMDVRARDRCNHGGLTVTYSWQNGRIEDTGGVLKVTSIAYKTSSSSSWRADGLTQGACAASARRGCILIKAGNHLDLSLKTRITHVRITTSLIYDPNTQDDSTADSKAFAPRTWTCDVRYAACKEPKKKRKRATPPGALPPPAPALPSANGGGSEPAPARPPSGAFGSPGGS
jgi:hypothetical protein